MRIYINGRFDEIPEPRTDQLVRTMTRAEYDQLTSEEKEGLILIADEDSSKQIVYSVSRSDIYSEEEKIVGRWIDGKPIYQKGIALSLSVPSGGEATIGDGSYIDTLIEARGSLTNLNSGRQIPIGQNYLSVSLTKAKNLAVIGNGNSASVCEGVVVIYYTKVDDEPETAETAINLTKYSTEEQIVGVWADGRPVYRKTILNPTTSTVLATDVDILVNQSCELLHSSGALHTLTLATTSALARYGISNGELKLVMNGEFLTSYQCRYVTIEYTKLTD